LVCVIAASTGGSGGSGIVPDVTGGLDVTGGVVVVVVLVLAGSVDVVVVVLLVEVLVEEVLESPETASSSASATVGVGVGASRSTSAGDAVGLESVSLAASLVVPHAAASRAMSARPAKSGERSFRTVAA
jgi:hypothetical protein